MVICKLHLKTDTGFGIEPVQKFQFCTFEVQE